MFHCRLFFDLKISHFNRWVPFLSYLGILNLSVAESRCQNLWSGFENLDIDFDDDLHNYVFTGEKFD